MYAPLNAAALAVQFGPYDAPSSPLPAGARGQGLGYERRAIAALRTMLPGLRHGQRLYIACQDGSTRVREVDALWLGPDWSLVVECKRTVRNVHWAQLDDYARQVALARPDAPVRAVMLGKGVARGESADVSVWLGRVGMEHLLASGATGPGRAVCHWTL